MLRIVIKDPVESMYQNLKAVLIYLETPECRSSLPEEVRRAELTEYTKRFRQQLIVRQKAIAEGILIV